MAITPQRIMPHSWMDLHGRSPVILLNSRHSRHHEQLGEAKRRWVIVLGLPRTH